MKAECQFFISTIVWGQFKHSINQFALTVVLVDGVVVDVLEVVVDVVVVIVVDVVD